MARYELLLSLDDVEDQNSPVVSITLCTQVIDENALSNADRAVIKYTLQDSTYIVSSKNDGSYDEVRAALDADGDGDRDAQDKKILLALANAFAQLDLDKKSETPES